MKYRCSICGYVYDEATEGVSFAELPDDWQCPLCGAPKSAFEPLEEVAEAPAPPSPTESALLAAATSEKSAEAVYDDTLLELSAGQMAALCSNLARGCEKQYMPEESALFNELATWFTRHAPKVYDATVEAVASQLQQNIADYPETVALCKQQGDRGAQRALSWSEKATRMISSLMSRYQREGDALLANTEIWVCSVCGFVYIGEKAPDLCPVCKVPAWKFNKIERRK